MTKFDEAIYILIVDLLESLQQEKGKRNTADDAFYEDLVQQMEADVEQMHITLIVEGEEYNVTEDGIEGVS